MRQQFRDTALDIAERDESIVMIFGDISVYLFNEFQQKHPNRFYNLGICENTMISVGAGLSAQGLNPFIHSIAPFITERSVEQIKLDMCYNNLGCNIVSCGASFDYAWDGCTHHAYMDLAILRMLPRMEVIQPGSKKEVDVLMRNRYSSPNPTYFRLSDNPHNIDIDVEFGKAVVLKDVGAKVTVMTAGPILGNVLEACKDKHVNLVYFHTLKPLDKSVVEHFSDTQILVVHDAYGLHEAICEVPGIRTYYHGIPDEFCGWYGTVHDIRERIGLDQQGIALAIAALLSK